MVDCLYKWVEYGVFMRIVKEGSTNHLEMHRKGQWRRTRVVSDKEYNLMFREKAKAFERGEIPSVDAPA